MSIPKVLEQIDKENLVSLSGKWYPMYQGVLSAAYVNGLRDLSEELVQAPTPENGNMAICRAVAVFVDEKGTRQFVGLGDCDDTNCTPAMSKSKIRLAATRAKGRALRDALRIGIPTADEMIGATDGTDTGESDTPRREQPPRQSATRKPARDQEPASGGEGAGMVAGGADGPFYCSECKAELTRDEVAGCRKRGLPMLCTPHGKAALAKKIAERPN